VGGDGYYGGVVRWFGRQPVQLERFTRPARAAQPVLLDSPQHQRLRWFAGDLLRYDLIDNQWVVTDLRLGMTGYHPFRFALARVEPAGVQLIEHAELWPTPDADLEDLKALQRRALDEDYPLSLARLAAPLAESPAAPCRGGGVDSPSFAAGTG